MSHAIHAETTPSDGAARSASKSTHATRATRATRATQEARALTLDALGTMKGEELDALYRHGTVPQDLSDVSGEPIGRMLAIRGVERLGPAFELVRRFAASRSLFPWEGKTFGAKTAARGTGINRVHVGALRMNWFPFETRVEPSMVDGAPCIYLDYAQPGNPWFIAKICDEIREVAPGLFLGPAMWKDGHGGAAHVLWFAVDFRAR
jgi:hypothetical protein